MAPLLNARSITPAQSFAAELRVPGDKSIAHRALMFASLAKGRSRIAGIPDGEDVAATIACLRRLGIAIDRAGDAMVVTGHELADWPSPTLPLDCRNSGTTMRLLTGLLAASSATVTLTGDASLSLRPMERVARALRQMGAQMETSDGHAPVRVQGAPLHGIRYHVEPPSAQVKSAILLAGLHATGETVVEEAVPTRDHTERLLHAMGARITTIAPPPEAAVAVAGLDAPLFPIDMAIPGDLSSAAFFLAAAAMRPGWTASIGDVGLNPTRTTFVDLLAAMGAQLQVDAGSGNEIEPRGQIAVRGATLRPLSLTAGQVAAAIDEIPLLVVLATQARGRSRFEGIGELRVKESDRVRAIQDGLRRMGASLTVEDDAITIDGPTDLQGRVVDAVGDHRIAMALAVAALVADGDTVISGADRADVSYPGFFEALAQATH